MSVFSAAGILGFSPPAQQNGTKGFSGNIMKTVLTLFTALFTLTLFVCISGCGAVPIDDRYGNGNSSRTEQSTTAKKFDFKAYSTIPGYYADSQKTDPAGAKIWYRYDTTETSLKKLVKVNGYRVQILSTDSFDEADNLKLDVHTRLQSTPVYVEFESPYYKVRVGDLVESNHAYDLSDKLKQLGYKNTLVVQDSVMVAK